MSTSWTLLSKIEKARRMERLETVSANSSLLVNKYAISWPKTKHRIQKNAPIRVEVLGMTLTKKFTAAAFSLRSSFDTLTLYKYKHRNLS